MTTASRTLLERTTGAMLSPIVSTIAAVNHRWLPPVRRAASNMFMYTLVNVLDAPLAGDHAGPKTKGQARMQAMRRDPCDIPRRDRSTLDGRPYGFVA